MNKIVLQHYPVDRLPEDLRRHFAPGTEVTVEVAAAPASDWLPHPRPEPMPVKELVASLRRGRVGTGGKGRSLEEITDEIRALRDEWDD